MSEHDNTDEFASLMSRLLDLRVNEPILAANMEKYMKPLPAKLAEATDQREVLNHVLQKLSKELGGSPEFYAVPLGQEKTKLYDEYGTAALSEVVNYFPRCRTAVVRAHMSMIAGWWLKHHPDVILPKNQGGEVLKQLVSDRYWEEAETAYIRLASYWDRVGQLLDFMYFNIRQYDKEGFAAVMDKIQVNYSPIYPELRISVHYKKLRGFQTSEETDGLKWLLRRRNLLVHSLRLREFNEDPEPNEIFTFAFNHLEEKYIKKLQPRPQKEETDLMHAHLAKAAELFNDVIALSELAMDLRIHTRRTS
jgi:hypothetical protein